MKWPADIKGTSDRLNQKTQFMRIYYLTSSMYLFSDYFNNWQHCNNNYYTSCELKTSLPVWQVLLLHAIEFQNRTICDGNMKLLLAVYHLAFIFLEIINSQEVHEPIQGMSYCLCACHY